MYAEFQDDKKKITKVIKEPVREGRFGFYIPCDYPRDLKKDQYVFIFTQDTLDEYTKHYDSKIIKVYESYKEDVESCLEMIENYKEENTRLKKLNKKLSETIVELKEKK